MDYVAYSLRGTLGINTPYRRFSILGENRGAAHRANLRHFKGARIMRSFFFYHSHNLRNDITGLLHNDRIADHYIPLFYKISVMKRCTAYRNARNMHGFKYGIGRKHARPSDLQDDIKKLRLLLLRRVFIRRRPPRELCRCAEHRSLAYAIYLKHRAVYLKSE